MVDFQHLIAARGEEGVLEVRTGRCHLMSGDVSAKGDAAGYRSDRENRSTRLGGGWSCRCDESLHVNSLASLLELVSFVYRTRRFDERYLAQVVCVYKIELCNIEPIGSIP